MTEAETYLAREGVVPGCRWGATRKAAFLQALKRWPDESADLMAQHNVSADEVVEWSRRYERGGRDALRSTLRH